MLNRTIAMLINIASTLVRPFAPILHRLGWLTPQEVSERAHVEAERLLEEQRWRIEAALEMERREIEWEKQAIEHDKLLLETYALSIGVPVAKRKEAMH